MARIFLSHSSSDNDLARALRDWLVGEGWDDLFLDFDPERGILAGEKWERALLDAAGRCEAVLFVVTRNWLGSGWCLKEFHLAEKLNKRMFMLLVDGLKVPDLPPELTAEWQLVDLSPGADVTSFHVSDGVQPETREIRFSNIGLRRLRSGLNKAGLDPRFFAWPPENDPDRPPYRGLRALESDDAGIFFGRDAQIVEALDRLRGLRDAAPPRFLAILGASGAGKSSFLRAGLLPRLERDDRHFCPLPVIRPERAVLSGENGLISALVAMFERVSNGISRRQIEDLIAYGAPALARILAKLAAVVRIPPLPGEPDSRPPSLVLSIDQGEELFLPDGAEEAGRFLTLLGELCQSPDINLIVLVSIRSDNYERLQTAPQLGSLRQDTLSLPPMPRGAYESVINGPAQRLSLSGRSLRVEPALTQALLADIESGGAKDALPLLAFTMELLYASHGRNGLIALQDYTALGGIKGSIEVAVERAMAAADADPRIPKDREQRLALMRRAFIPWLAGVDLATNTVRRRVARMAEVPDEARPMVECLIGARLLSTDVTLSGEVTVEPAHEALLRQWGLLHGWLEENFAAMAALDGVQRAAREWEANARDPDWLAHSAGRLEDAEASNAQEHLKGLLSGFERDYLRECRLADDARRNRELEEARKLAASRAQTVRRTRIGLGVALVLFAAAAVAGWYATLQRDEATRQSVIARAEAQKALASLSVVRARQARTTGNTAAAAGHALEGYRTLANLETRSNLLDVALAIDPHLAFTLPLPDENELHTAMTWLTPDQLVLATKTGTRTGLVPVTFGTDTAPVRGAGWAIPKVMFDAEDEAEFAALRAMPDGRLLAVRNSGVIELYRTDGTLQATWTPPKREDGYDFPRAAISPDGRLIALGGSIGASLVQCTADLSCAMEDMAEGEATSVAIGADGRHALIAFADGTLMSGGGPAARERLPFGETGASLRALAPAGKHIAAILGAPNAPMALVLLERRDGAWQVVARGPVALGTAPVLLWRDAGSSLLHSCQSDDLKPGPLCETTLPVDTTPPAWGPNARWPGHTTQATLLALAGNGARLATRAPDGLRIWQWPQDRSIHSNPVHPPAGGWASLMPSPAGELPLLTAKDGLALHVDVSKDPQAQAALPVLSGEIIAAMAIPGGRVVASGNSLAFVPTGASVPSRSLDLPAAILPQGGLDWTGRGLVMAVAMTDQTIGLVDFGTDTPELNTFAPPDGAFQPFGLVADRQRGHILASGTDGRIHVLDVMTRAPLGTLANTHVPNVADLLGAEGLTVSADGRRLATTAKGGRVMLYDLERRSSLALIATGDSDTKSVAFDAAGARLAVIDSTSTVSLWSIGDGTPQLHLSFRLDPSRRTLPVSLPTILFSGTGGLLALNQASELHHIALDEIAWTRRIVKLGFSAR